MSLILEYVSLICIVCLTDKTARWRRDHIEMSIIIILLS